jgi:hypothetical protein
MINHILIHTITISRRTETGRNPLNEKTYSYANAYTAVAARVETFTKREDLEYRTSGQRPTPNILVYLENDKTILPEDIIIAVSVPGYTNGEEIGRAMPAKAVLKGIVSGLHHIEFMVEPK